MKFQKTSKAALLALSLFLSHTSFAQDAAKVDPAASLQQKSEKGWFFYEEPIKPKEEVKKPVPKPGPIAQPGKRKDELCQDPEQWTPDCGFVDPGKNMKFQAKQRDQLLETMALSKNDPKAVEHFQRYMKFVMERASEVSNNWYFNLVQKPDLDPSVTAPISSFGIDLMSKVKTSKQKDLFNLLKSEGAILIYFTKSDCIFCHQMKPTAIEVAKEIGIPVFNAALDAQCMPGMEQGCLSGDAVTPAATALQVSVVPTLVLHVPKKTFIRVSAGIVDKATALQRTSSFFNAYRTALQKGIQNSTGENIPSVDFSSNEATGLGQGIPKAPEKGKAPNQESIEKMLSQ